MPKLILLLLPVGGKPHIGARPGVTAGTDTYIHYASYKVSFFLLFRRPLSALRATRFCSSILTFFFSSFVVFCNEQEQETCVFLFLFVYLFVPRRAPLPFGVGVANTSRSGLTVTSSGPST